MDIFAFLEKLQEDARKWRRHSERREAVGVIYLGRDADLCIIL